MRIVNANKFGIFGPLRQLAEKCSTGRQFRVRECSADNAEGWRAEETDAIEGQNNYPGLEFNGPQPQEIEAMLRQCCGDAAMDVSH